MVQNSLDGAISAIIAITATAAAIDTTAAAIATTATSATNTNGLYCCWRLLCRFYCFAALAHAPCCISFSLIGFSHRIIWGVHYTVSREISSFPLFPASSAPPGRLRIELLKKITVRLGDVAVASRPASLSVVGRAQGALVSVYGAKAFAHPLAALQLLLQGRGPRPDLCFTSFADEFAATVVFVIPPALWARVV